MTIQKFFFGTTFVTNAIRVAQVFILLLSVGLGLISIHFKLNHILIYIIALIPFAYVLLFYYRNTSAAIELEYDKFKNSKGIKKTFYICLVSSPYLIVLMLLIAIILHKLKFL